MRISDWSSDVCSSDLFVGADVSRGRGQSFAYDAAHDQQVLVDHAGSGNRDGNGVDVAAKAFPQVNAALRAKALHWLAGGGVESVEPLLHGDVDAQLGSGAGGERMGQYG